MLDTIYLVCAAGPTLRALQRAFQDSAPQGCEVVPVESVDELEQHLTSTANCLVVVDADLGGSSDGGLDLIRALRSRDRNLPLVLVAEKGDVDLAAQAIAAGATDFFVRGERLEERIVTLLGKLRGLFEVIAKNRLLDEQNATLREAIRARLRIIGESAQIGRVIEQARRVAAVPRPVLIVGERGTGKELVARAIHVAAFPTERPIVTVNCAAFNDALLESELFGHEKGAFTGAEALRRGRFEQADGGTLFLDEIVHMSLAFQQKILRVVEYGTFTRVGGVREISTCIRIIAATYADLQERIRSCEFLSDLYDRLAFEVIEVPPLREREGDIEVLAKYFLEQFAREIPAFKGKHLSQTALDRLKRYRFPGNVRELKNIIERAAYRDMEGEIMPEDLGLIDRDVGAEPGGSFKERVDAYSRRLLQEALEESQGNQAEAARLLGLSYHQFRYFRRKLG